MLAHGVGTMSAFLSLLLFLLLHVVGVVESQNCHQIQQRSMSMFEEVCKGKRSLVPPIISKGVKRRSGYLMDDTEEESEEQFRKKRSSDGDDIMELDIWEDNSVFSSAPPSSSRSRRNYHQGRKDFWYHLGKFAKGCCDKGGCDLREHRKFNAKHGFCNYRNDVAAVQA